MTTNIDFIHRDKQKGSDAEDRNLLTKLIATDKRVKALIAKSAGISEKSPGTLVISEDLLLLDGMKMLEKVRLEYQDMTVVGEAGGWKTYAAYRFLCYVDDLLRIYQIAERVFYSSSPEIVRNEYEIGDLISQAYIGLIDALGRYKRSDGGWQACSGLRIRGSIVDTFYRELSYGEISKGAVRRKKEISQIKEQLTKAKGSASLAEIAEALGEKEEKINAAMGECFNVSSLEKVREDGEPVETGHPLAEISLPLEARMEIEEIGKLINTCLQEMGDTARRVLNLIYVHGVKQNVIAHIIGIRPAEVYKITRGGKAGLYDCLKKYNLMGDFDAMVRYAKYFKLNFGASKIHGDDYE